MPRQSLFTACKNIIRTGTSGTESVDGYDIDFEYYTQADIDANVEAIAQGIATKCTFGDSDQSKVVLVAGDTLTIPAGFNLIPQYPKKSLVILCNKFINNGTISMTAKGPNIAPHPYLLLRESDNYGGADIIIPAYANNRATSTNAPCNGVDGTDRNCGSGGSGCCYRYNTYGTYTFKTGSGSAFAGGAGTGGIASSVGSWYPEATSEVDTTYPMRGARGYAYGVNSEANNVGYGGVGNPYGASYHSNGSAVSYTQNTGVGGRVIIFCSTFTNNGSIYSNGVTAINSSVSTSSVKDAKSSGGSSGAGAIDVFYNVLAVQGIITANGGAAVSAVGSISASGKGGNGSITLLGWDITKVYREEEKVFTRENMVYLLNEFTKRLQENHIGE